MSIKVEISGLRQLARNIESYNEGKKKELRNAANGAGVNVDRKAKRKTPVDTGRLRSSLHVVVAGTNNDPETGISTDELEAAVATNVEYAKFVEKGTARMKARPFLFPAWESERPAYIRKVKSILSKR